MKKSNCTVWDCPNIATHEVFIKKTSKGMEKYCMKHIYGILNPENGFNSFKHSTRKIGEKL